MIRNPRITTVFLSNATIKNVAFNLVFVQTQRNKSWKSGIHDMTHKIPMKGGGEYDAFTSWRKVLRWRPGLRKWWKRRYNKRVRKQGKDELETMK